MLYVKTAAPLPALNSCIKMSGKSTGYQSIHIIFYDDLARCYTELQLRTVQRSADPAFRALVTFSERPYRLTAIGRSYNNLQLPEIKKRGKMVYGKQTIQAKKLCKRRY